MTRQLCKFRILLAGLLIAMGTAPAQNKAQPDWHAELGRLRASVEDLQQEMSALRDMLSTLQLERHREAIRRIAAELEATRAERMRLSESDQIRQHDLRDLENLLTEGRSDTAGVEAARSDLAVARAREISNQSEAIRTREGELLRRLETEIKAARQLEQVLSTQKGKLQ